MTDQPWLTQRITHTYVPDSATVEVVLTTVTGSGRWHALARYADVMGSGVVEEASAERETDALFILAGRLAEKVSVLVGNPAPGSPEHIRLQAEGVDRDLAEHGVNHFLSQKDSDARGEA